MDLSKLDKVTLLALCIWGEARGEPIEAQVGVGCVVRNRVNDPGKDWWGDTYREVLLKPKQFSCFNLNDPNRAKIEHILEEERAADYLGWVPEMQSQMYCQCYWVADGVYEDSIIDNTRGSTHYHSGSIVPSWAVGKEPRIQLGRLVFYKIGTGS